MCNPKYKIHATYVSQFQTFCQWYPLEVQPLWQRSQKWTLSKMCLKKRLLQSFDVDPHMWLSLMMQSFPLQCLLHSLSANSRLLNVQFAKKEALIDSQRRLDPWPTTEATPQVVKHFGEKQVFSHLYSSSWARVRKNGRTHHSKTQVSRSSEDTRTVECSLVRPKSYSLGLALLRTCWGGL